MRIASAIVVFVCLSLTARSAAAADGESAKTPEKIEHPAEVALVQLESSAWRYVQFPSNLRLYVFDGDSPGKSACNVGCEGAWPPLKAPEDAKPVGNWTPFARHDGRKQWAYKGRPVYIRFHDSPAFATGNGVDGTWHFLEP
jgi:predicted lipoprotein with Yx(FWY)xxD motif